MENELLKIGAAYIRVSDERQDEYSPDSQLKKIREYAEKDGYLIPEEYVFYDDGISGKTAKKRGEFNRMIAIAKDKEKPFDAIFVWKFSRFARNQEESLVYKNLLRKKGVSVISVSEALPEGPYGSLIERIIEWMDEFYLINLGTEVTRGMTEKVSRGEPIVAPPFGYIMKDKRYYPDEDGGTADIVREIFDRYINGESQKTIAIDLGLRGIKTKFGNKPDNRFIEYILNNPVYIGKIRFSQNGTQALNKRDYENENILTVDAVHDPIISMDVWDKAQKMLERKKAMYQKYSRSQQHIDHMLKGLVRCSNCGGTLAMASVVRKDGTRSLQCCNYARGVCRVSHYIQLPIIEEAFISGLKSIVANQSFDIVPAKTERKQTQSIDFDALIAAEKRKLERAKQAYLAEIDTLEQYAEHKKQIDANISSIEAMRSEDAQKNVNIKSFSKKVEKTIKLIENPKVTPKAKNEALRAIIESVVYEKEKRNISIHFHDVSL